MFEDIKKEEPVVDIAAVAKKAVTAAKAAVSDDEVVRIRNHSGLSSLVFGDGTVARFHEGVARIKAKYLVQAVAQGCTVETDAPAAPKQELSAAQKAELEKVFGKSE
jgi:hypothetical protein